MQPELIITISKIGVPKIEAVGFTGGSCLSATKPILDALTGKNSNPVVTEKMEMHLAEQNTEPNFLYQ